MGRICLHNKVTQCAKCPTMIYLTNGDFIPKSCKACGLATSFVVHEINDEENKQLRQQAENLRLMRQEEINTVKAFKRYLDKFGDY